MVGEKKNPKKVAIVGSASSTKGMTPWGDHTFEIWGLAWRGDLRRCDRFFDMHKIDKDRKHVPANYEQKLANLGKPVYLIHEHPDVPNSVRYPIEKVIDFLGPNLDPYANGDYFVSSIAFMIALAIYEQYDEIHLYGIDLIDDTEYAHQRPNTEYLLGIARGLGIRVFIPEGAALLRYNHRYGYQKPPSIGIINHAVLNSRLAEYKKRKDQLIAELQTIDGAMQEAEHLIGILKYNNRGRAEPESIEGKTAGGEIKNNVVGGNGKKDNGQKTPEEGS